MKNILMGLCVSLACSLSIAAEKAKTQDWMTSNAPHPLWDVLKVSVDQKEDEAFVIERKEAGGVVCTKTSLKVSAPLAGREYQIHCEFPKELKSQQVISLYKALDVQPLETNNVTYELKQVDRLLVVAEPDDADGEQNRLFIDHACRQVNTLADARQCMDFWATEVMTSYEEPNEGFVVPATDKNVKYVQKNLRWSVKNEKMLKEADELLAKSEFIGLMSEHADEHHIYYYALARGQNVVPIEIFDVNEADITYTELGDAVKEVAPAELDAFLKTVAETLFVGLSVDKFEHFWENVEESLRMAHEDEQ